MAIGAIWADIWDEAIWNTTIWSQVGVEPEPEPEPSPRKGASKRKRKRYVVEVDGQLIPAASIAEVQAVLANARELAQQTAPKDVRPKVRIKPPRVAVRTASGPSTSQTIQREVRRTQDFINTTYRRAQESLDRTLEIAMLMRRKMQEDDDEEAVIALLL